MQVKLVLDDASGGSFRLLEAMEAMSLGIEGKKCLWVVLSKVVETSPELGGVDYQGLIDRAEQQRSRVEGVRIQAAVLALVSNA